VSDMANFAVDFGEPNPVIVPPTYTEAEMREAQAVAWDEGFDRGFYDPLAGSDRDASESLARNPYRAVTVRGGE